MYFWFIIRLPISDLFICQVQISILCSSDSFCFLEELMTSPKTAATSSVHCWQFWGSFCFTGKHSPSKLQLTGPNFLLLNANGSFGANVWENAILYCLFLQLLLEREISASGHGMQENCLLITDCNNYYLLWLRMSNIFHKKMSCFNFDRATEKYLF